MVVISKKMVPMLIKMTVIMPMVMLSLIKIPRLVMLVEDYHESTLTLRSLIDLLWIDLNSCCAFLNSSSINTDDDTNNIGSYQSMLVLRLLIDLLMIKCNGSFSNGDSIDAGSNKSNDTWYSGDSVDSDDAGVNNKKDIGGRNVSLCVMVCCFLVLLLLLAFVLL